MTLSRACAVVAWTLSVFAFMAAWIVFLASSDPLGILLAVTGMLFVAIGAVLTIRGWVGRVCQVIRTTSRGPSGENVSSLH